MSRYFTHVSGSINNPKNKLENDLQGIFIANDARILDSDSQMLELASTIHKMNVEFNKLHPRCKPVAITSTKNNKGSYYHFPGGMFMVLKERVDHGKEN